MVQEPEDAIRFSSLKTQEEWVRAGQVVFDGPFNPSAGQRGAATRVQRLAAVSAPREGWVAYPWVRYWVVKKGDVRAFFTKCGSCHTRVLHDGTVVPGAQGNLDQGDWQAALVQRGATSLEQWRYARRRQDDAPWLSPSPAEPFLKATADEAAAFERAVIAGVRFRIGTSHLYPPKIPDLIGVADRRYLDATGLYAIGRSET